MSQSKRKYIPPHLRNSKHKTKQCQIGSEINRFRGLGYNNDNNKQSVSYNRYQTQQTASNSKQNKNRNRTYWRIGTKIEIYSDLNRKWQRGEIIKIYNNNDGEWLVVNYNGYKQKELQRFSKQIRSLQTQIHNNYHSTFNGNNRFSRFTPHHNVQINKVLNKNKVYGPIADARGHSTIVFTVKDERIHGQQQVLKAALEFVNDNPLPSPTAIRGTFGNNRTTSGSTAHVKYTSRMSFHSIFHDVTTKQANNPSQTQILLEKFKGDTLNEIEYFLTFIDARNNKINNLRKCMEILPKYDDLKAVQAMKNYMDQHNIIFNEELDECCIYETEGNVSNMKQMVDIKAVMNGFEEMHKFGQFIQSHYERNKNGLLSFIDASKSSNCNLNQLLKDTGNEDWNRTNGYYIDYNISQSIVHCGRMLPFTLKLLLVNDMKSYLSKRMNIEQEKKNKLIKMNENAIGKTTFYGLLSIIDGTKAPLKAPPIDQSISVRYIRYSSNMIQFIYNNGTFTEYNLCGKDAKDIRFRNIGLAKDEYLIGVLISHQHCLFMTSHHIMTGSPCWDRYGSLGFSSANLFHVERGQHIVGFNISKNNNNNNKILYDAVTNVIASKYNVNKIKDVIDSSTDEGKCDDMKHMDLVKFPSIFKRVKFENLFRSSSISMSSKQESNINHNIINMMDDNNKLNENGCFFVASYDHHDHNPDTYIYSFPSTFYRISKDFNFIEKQIDIEIKNNLEQMKMNHS